MGVITKKSPGYGAGCAQTAQDKRSRILPRMK
jgi:hypothetical protein